jgi:tetratricopeptide (TPR) repeat protein
MMTRISLFALVGFLLALSPVSAQAPPAKKTKEQEANEKLLKDVFERLLAVAKPVEGYDWPPNCAIVEEDQINAYATLLKDKNDVYRIPILRVYATMMNKVIEGDENRLALILGHEFGHILHKHNVPQPMRDKTPFLRTLFTRQQEDEADKTGVELMVKAGFSFEKGVKAITRMQDLGLEYSSFEGLGTDHPSWNDRLKKFDGEKVNLWKVSSAFTNGVYFLATEQYKYAAPCFEFVTKEYPAVHEAWANLGYAYLMQYCDQLDKKDLEGYDIGQIIVGGFYTRAGLPTRLKDFKKWNLGKSALEESNKLLPNQTIVLANLGLAYLVHPDGKDLANATKFFNLAVAAAKDDKALDPSANAALMINLGVANLANAEPEKAIAQIDETEKAVRNLADRRHTKRLMASYDAALQYNRALVLGARPDKADKEKAIHLLEKYLETTSPLTLWWEIAHGKYEKLCTAVGQPAKPADSLKKARTIALRGVAGVKLNSGIEIALSEEKEDIEKKIGQGTYVQVIKGTSLSRLRFEKEGVELLSDDLVVLAIALIGPNAPAIPIKGSGIGAETAGIIKVGMNVEASEKLLGDDFQLCEIISAEVFYRYYREVGLALRVQKGLVTEVVIVQMPDPQTSRR